MLLHKHTFGVTKNADKAKSGRNVYSAIATTDGLDRDKEVVLPKGVIMDNFMKNPVMLFIHSYGRLPVGKVVDLKVEDEQITFEFEFAEDEEGQKLERMYETGFMNAFSIGFLSKQYIRIDNETPETIEVKLPGGKKQQIDLSKYQERPRGIIPEWELLEISPVPIPANPDALIQRTVEGVLNRYKSKGFSNASAQILDQQMHSQIDSVLEKAKTFWDMLVKEEDPSPSSVVPYIACQNYYESESDDSTGKSLAVIAAYASEDGTGDKSKMDWGKFSSAFAYVDIAKSDRITSYKFLHHTVRSNEFVVDVRNLYRSMAELLEKQSAYSEDEAKAIYEHLAKHYEDCEKEAPEFRNDYDEATLEAIAIGQIKKEEVKDADSEKTDDNDNSSKTVATEEILKVLSDIHSCLKENETLVNTRLNIVASHLVELLEDVKDVAEKLSKTGKVVTTKTDANKDDDDDGGNEMDLMKIDLDAIFKQVEALSTP